MICCIQRNRTACRCCTGSCNTPKYNETLLVHEKHSNKKKLHCVLHTANVIDSLTENLPQCYKRKHQNKVAKWRLNFFFVKKQYNRLV